MVVYIDILIVENIIINFFLLYMTNKTINGKGNYFRIFISSLIGSFYIITMFIDEVKFLSRFPFNFIISIIMVVIVYQEKKFLDMIKIMFLFMCYSMTLSGIFTFLNNSRYSYLFNYKTILLALLLFIIASDRIFTYIKSKISLNSLIYRADIIFKDKIVSVNAFLDTGNELRETITNLPVMVIEECKINKSQFNKDEIYIIPFMDVSGKIGKLTAFKPSNVILYRENKKENKEFIIAITESKLSNEDEYNALLSRSAI